MKRMIVLLVGLAAACHGRHAQHAPPDAVMNSIRVVHDTIRGLAGVAAYRPLGGDSLVVESWLGTSSPTFLVVSTWEPEGADYSGPMLYILRPGEEIAWGVNGTPTPDYPGDITNMHDSLVMQSRAFVGLCADSTRMLGQFIHYRPGGKGPWLDSTQIYFAQGDSLKSVGNDATFRIQDVLQRVAGGGCREIVPKAHTTPSDEVDDDSA